MSAVRSLPSQRAHSAAIVAHLESELARPVGQGKAPDAADPEFPYHVMYRLPDIARSGPLNDDEADIWVEFQVTSVSNTPEGAETAAGNVQAAMHIPGTPFAVPARKLGQMQTTRSAGVERDPDQQPPLFYCIDIFNFWSYWQEAGEFGPGFDEGFS
jgi:hypothetical protein